MVILLFFFCFTFIYLFPFDFSPAIPFLPPFLRLPIIPLLSFIQRSFVFSLFYACLGSQTDVTHSQVLFATLDQVCILFR